MSANDGHLMSEWKRQCLTYIDHEGLMGSSPSPTPRSNGNGIKDLGLFHVLLALRGELDIGEAHTFDDVLSACSDEPGLLNRFPSHPDQEAHDNYIGAAAGSYFGTKRTAHDIWAYGRKHGFYYDNVDDNAPYWGGLFARWVWLPAFFAVARGGALAGVSGAMARLSLRLFFFLKTLRPGSNSGMILTWLIAVVCMHAGVEKQAAEKWYKALLMSHPLGITDIFRDYYGSAHPFTSTFVKHI